MPQIAAAASAAFTYVSGASAAVAAGTATLAQTLTVAAVNVAASVATSAVMSALSPGVGAEGSPTQFRLDTDAGIPFAFGRVASAGIVAHRDSYGATLRYQSVVATLSGAGPVQGNYSIRIDDELTTFGAGGAATSGDHVGALWFTIKDGAQPDTALSSPSGLELSVTLPNWGTDYKMNGRSAFMITCYENSKYSEYRRGFPKPLVEYDGKFGYDPREDDTYPGGEGDCRLDDPDTWLYIDNPIIAALNWAIGMWEGDSGSSTYGVPYACSLVGGVGSSIDGIDVAAFVNAANVAEANGWGVSALPTTKDDKFQVLTALLQAGGAYPSRNAGRISCVTYGEAQASVVTVTARDTAGPVEVNLGQSRLERINTALPKYWSSNHRWQMTQLGPVSNSAWVTEDGGTKRSRGIDFPYVGDADQAAQLAYYAIADAREAVTGRVPFKPHMRQVQPGDCFTFDEPGFLLDGVKVKCLRRSIDPMTLKVMIEFRQETDAKHAAALAQTGSGPGSVTPSGPPDDTVDPPTGESISVSGDEVTIDWTNGTARFFRTLILQSATSDIEDATQVASKGGGPGEAQTAVLKPGPGTWYFWIMSRSAPAEDYSDPVSLGSVVVEGPAASTVSGLGDLATKNTVNTPDIDDNSVISIDPFEFSGTVTTSGATSDASAVTVMEFEVDSDGEPLLIETEMMAKFWHPAAGDFSFTLRFQRVGAAGTLRNDLVVDGINGDQFHGFLSPRFVDVPGSGTHTYKVFAWASTDTGFTHRDFTDRIATVTHLKATTLA